MRWLVTDLVVIHNNHPGEPLWTWDLLSLQLAFAQTPADCVLGDAELL
jgi:hypothetical protein